VRISNFLLWQVAYSELYFTDCLWPDFDERELDKAFGAYAARDRRFGGVKADAAATGGRLPCCVNASSRRSCCSRLSCRRCSPQSPPPFATSLS
jgi:hypothetical protein